jgi:hypothetical protein
MKSCVHKIAWLPGGGRTSTTLGDNGDALGLNIEYCISPQRRKARREKILLFKKSVTVHSLPASASLQTGSSTGFNAQG